ncbi:hypothetical protein Goklo_004701 [Gossypium klotzschianum]|uniref:Uncharacterized protein n=1 Tax=Gossypium klotzschianum TaxID=34286 RepID=A0A7J8VQ56_9ROSI|nr:hypothetical protein [Gossypium klotzschianum]
MEKHRKYTYWLCFFTFQCFLEWSPSLVEIFSWW